MLDLAGASTALHRRKQTWYAAEPIYSGALPYETETPVACDSLFFAVEQEEGAAPVTLHLLAESGVKKVVLTPFLNTTEGMTAISGSYNDDGTFTTAGLEGFPLSVRHSPAWRVRTAIL